MARLLQDRAARPFVVLTLVGVALIAGGQVLGVISPLVYGAGVAACLIGTTAARASVAETSQTEPASPAATVEVPLVTVRVWQLAAALGGLVVVAAAALLVTG